jgi:hypothetical protein
MPPPPSRKTRLSQPSSPKAPPVKKRQAAIICPLNTRNEETRIECFAPPRLGEKWFLFKKPLSKAEATGYFRLRDARAVCFLKGVPLMNRLIVTGMGISLCFSVSAIERYVDLNNPTPVAPYTNWSSAATDIQTAVNAAVSGDTVWVTNGHYKLTEEILITNNISVVSVNGPSVTFVDGQWNSRCFYLSSSSSSITGFRIENGFAFGTYEQASDCGGGVFAWPTDPEGSSSLSELTAA